MSTDRESGRGNKKGSLPVPYPGGAKKKEKKKGKSDKRITESKERQKESTTLCTNLAD
jgi:hypothetical protein